MSAVVTAVQAAIPVSGLPLALTIATAVTALVAVGMVVTKLRRTSRLTPIIGGLGAASAVGILVLAVFIGSAVSSGATASPAVVPAATTVVSSPTTVSTSDSDGVQLPTLSLDN